MIEYVLLLGGIRVREKFVATSCYQKWNNAFQCVSISGDRGKKVNFEGKFYKDLAPKKAFWEVWENNIGKISEEENNKFYIREYYRQVLSKLDPYEVYSDLDGKAMLCYENADQFCHRHIVAAWLELLLGVEVPEVEVKTKTTKIGDEEVTYLSMDRVDRPSYIKEYLEELLKEEMEMYGFKSVRAAYLYKQSILPEDKASLVEAMGYSGDSYRQEACYLRCEADMAEDEYKERLRRLKPEK